MPAARLSRQVVVIGSVVHTDGWEGCLDEFTFRFNRRTSRSRGKLFYRLVQQAAVVEPVPYKAMVKHVRGRTPKGHKI